MDSLLRDLKFSARSLLKHPGFAAVAVLTHDEKNTAEIIGVVADVKNGDLEEIPDATSYLPYSQIQIGR
ncbi:MAG TPA: hypothetical protein VGO73_06460 [Pyrinomonadaceae bacterium]|jgi:hypothetical protein|nr:hypothetical protein [Pyrinomonadaceae bacterium]